MTHDHGSCGCGCGGHASPLPTGRDWAAATDGEVVCPCLGLTKARIVAVIRAGAYTLPLVKVMTGAGRGQDCKSLHPQGRSCEADLAELLRLYALPPDGCDTGGCGH